MGCEAKRTMSQKTRSQVLSAFFFFVVYYALRAKIIEKTPVFIFRAKKPYYFRMTLFFNSLSICVPDAQMFCFLLIICLTKDTYVYKTKFTITFTLNVNMKSL
ncbi:hypothetical protein GOODEAATRI_029281 [Goodea atripinnis]|uniref:Uncharacterized protein n=1 Tax=Goodea atripinnis TaxID=208336 RepID=A0ABV0PI65_9TELE